MSLVTTIGKIDDVSMQFAPIVLANVAAVEAAAAGLPGQTKADIVLNAVMASAHAAEGVPIPSVQGIAALIEMFVTILSVSGVFKHKAKPGLISAAVVATGTPPTTFTIGTPHVAT
jgi:hypothetical protein